LGQIPKSNANHVSNHEDNTNNHLLKLLEKAASGNASEKKMSLSLLSQQQDDMSDNNFIAQALRGLKQGHTTDQTSQLDMLNRMLAVGKSSSNNNNLPLKNSNVEEQQEQQFLSMLTGSLGQSNLSLNSNAEESLLLKQLQRRLEKNSRF
jgi:hypothetical protein